MIPRAQKHLKASAWDWAVRELKRHDTQSGRALQEGLGHSHQCKSRDDRWQDRALVMTRYYKTKRWKPSLDSFNNQTLINYLCWRIITETWLGVHERSYQLGSIPFDVVLEIGRVVKALLKNESFLHVHTASDNQWPWQQRNELTSSLRKRPVSIVYLGEYMMIDILGSYRDTGSIFGASLERSWRLSWRIIQERIPRRTCSTSRNTLRRIGKIFCQHGVRD